MKTLVLGLGNPILSDDGVGIRVARALAGCLDAPDVTIMEANVGGLNLLDLLTGFDRAIIIDAIKTNDGKPGKVYRLGPESFDVTRRGAATHGISLSTALELGRRIGLPLPTEIVILGVEVADISTFSEKGTREVERAIPACIKKVIEELRESTGCQVAMRSRAVVQGNHEA
jgi:hydrogenase maturation protease